MLDLIRPQVLIWEEKQESWSRKNCKSHPNQGLGDYNTILKGNTAIRTITLKHWNLITKIAWLVI